MEMRHFDWCGHALPLNDRLFRQPFYVTHAGHERVKPRQVYPHPGQPQYYDLSWGEGRILGEFCLSLITEGRGELDTVRGHQPIRAVQAWLYLPGEWHRHRPTLSVGWTNHWIKFNGSLAHQWMQDRAFRLSGNLVQLSDPRLFARQFRHLVESIDRAKGRNSLQFSWQAIGLLSHFLVDHETAENPRTARTGDSMVDAVRNYVWSQSHNQISVLDVARHTGINRRTLERGFKAATGTTLFSEIQHCRISRAALLLRETDVPIKYILGRTGFTGYQQIRESFHRHFGVSPERYRASGLLGSPGREA
jgi:AraC-like DNA-binding protein